ncbi:MAG: signal recognition particle-docking protein FtsY [Candidatus Micrarchaeota archaeon]|nr:signal recognition particle-docking protein FtsY [Candidatus Micrarchaeota archaeon]
MFGLLKNKLTSFIKSVTGRKETEKEAPQQQQVSSALPAPKEIQVAPITLVPEIKQVPVEEHKAKPAPVQEHVAKPKTAPEHEAKQKPHEIPKEEHHVPAQKVHERAHVPVHAPTPEKPVLAKPIAKEVLKPAPKEELKVEKEIKPAPSVPIQHKPSPSPSLFSQEPTASAPAQKPVSDSEMSGIEKRAMSNKRETAPKIGLGTALKSIFSSDITIGESEVSDLLSELELSLLEADVAFDVSLQVTERLRARLVGMKVPKGKVEARIKETIRDVLEAIMENDLKFSLPERAKSLPKPVKILFVGPNGAGKTTTMAKVARLLMDSGLSVMFSASDTFRAAAIEQAEVHASRLGINIVKSGYGADPASVAFDAINFARSHKIDVVLIDSAGRQDTNANLLDELKKINRIAKPDMKIYIGESIGGNSIIEQIKAFNESIGIDGAILTKIDCDAKGGTAISVSCATGIPILLLGVGQGYHDLVPFDPHKIAGEIMN